MSRGIDHIVHAVRDLDAAAALYRGLGFTVGARNRHPRAWGTQNQIIQLAETSIELLAVTDPEGIAPHRPRHFSFGAFNQDFLSHTEGLSMLVLKGRGAPDAEEFCKSGIGDFEPYNLEREGKRPDGTTVKVAFSLAFARDAAAPDIGFFTCRQHYPENFWNPAFQKHTNSALAVAGIVAVAREPDRHRAFMQAFIGGDGVPADGGFAINTPRGTIEMTMSETFVRRFGVPAPDVSRGPRLAAIRFTVADGRLAQQAAAASIAVIYAGNAAIIGANDAMGAVIVFEPAR